MTKALKVTNELEVTVKLDHLAKIWEFNRDKLLNYLNDLNIGAKINFPDKVPPVYVIDDDVYFNVTFLLGNTGSNFAAFVDLE